MLHEEKNNMASYFKPMKTSSKKQTKFFKQYNLDE